MHFRWFSAGVLLVASCAAESGESQKESRPSVQALDDSEGDARERLRARLEATRFLLAPSGTVEAATAFDGESARVALEQVTGVGFQAQTTGDAWTASGSGYSASFDSKTGHLALRGERSYERGLAHAEDAAFESRARTLLGGFAPDLAQQTLDLRHLGATTRVLGDEVTQTDERLGSKVFVIRHLGGIRVAGSRLVASFATDGRLVGARGLWPAIDLAHSQLEASITEQEARERALDVLVEHGVNPEREDPIDLETFYQLERAEQGSVVRLRGAAIVTSYDHEESPGRRERHEFDL